jgi:hypothetical protein
MSCFISVMPCFLSVLLCSRIASLLCVAPFCRLLVPRAASLSSMPVRAYMSRFLRRALALSSVLQLARTTEYAHVQNNTGQATAPAADPALLF